MTLWEFLDTAHRLQGSRPGTRHTAEAIAARDFKSLDYVQPDDLLALQRISKLCDDTELRDDIAGIIAAAEAHNEAVGA